MSCPSSQNALILTVSMGQLPEGFCPPNLQELANAIASRIIIAPSEASLLIVGGGTEPASNVGPWFKNCEEIFVFDDSTGRYRPIEKSGFNTLQIFEASGDFTVPDNVFRISAEGWGGGGGGSNTDASGGAGSGGYGQIIRDVVPGQVIPIVIGAGGAPGANGGDTTILGMTCGGGFAGALNEPVDGGTVTGADFFIAGSYGHHSGNFMGWGGSAPRGGCGGVTGSVTAAFFNGKAPGGGGATRYISGPFNAAGTGGRGAVNINY